MGRTVSSQRWLHEHFTDPYVQRAKQEGWRSRAVYKLIEMQERDRILRPGQVVVDLGAAPGGWSQYAAGVIGDQGRLFALDILPMDSFAGVDFIQGDFTEQAVFEQLLERLDGRTVDVVLSDMAPNMSGQDSVDQPRAMYLAELAADFAARVLGPQGVYLVKLFQGAGFDAYLRELRNQFASVTMRKPDASRSRSREVYALARNPRVV
ncbi:23S rRNA (uridine(2552)-2'-O)-methyltransferase RlmE [Thiofaba sp. EF100]|jgi:23S rRNA (uridine2552-2'-O)-methyltransferase|uniref:23S rRNA (uridine(2552)-2'-O)-methyltransferase RlmE n=1 Tax=Thiofaba sp. EF100 TaxID=3121274 RepID=UPI003221C174